MAEVYYPKKSVQGIVHKRDPIHTLVKPRGHREYTRINYRHVLCNTPWLALGEHDVVTPYDQDVTCPECLEKLGQQGRRA